MVLQKDLLVATALDRVECKRRYRETRDHCAFESLIPTNSSYFLALLFLTRRDLESTGIADPRFHRLLTTAQSRFTRITRALLYSLYFGSLINSESWRYYNGDPVSLSYLERLFFTSSQTLRSRRP